MNILKNNDIVSFEFDDQITIGILYKKTDNNVWFIQIDESPIDFCYIIKSQEKLNYVGKL